jgi:hypothetical protein
VTTVLNSLLQAFLVGLELLILQTEAPIQPIAFLALLGTTAITQDFPLLQRYVLLDFIAHLAQQPRVYLALLVISVLRVVALP